MGNGDVRESMAEFARGEVARARSTCAMIVNDAVECFDGEGEPAELRELAWELVPQAFAAHLEAQATWPARTDSDRLTDAFRALDIAGIVAREDFTCCQNCGVTDIRGEVKDGSSARGYVFYHEQDARRAVEGGGLWLAFGTLGDASADQIGEEIVAALRAEGLHVDWDGSAGQRIHARMTWARRRHGRMAAFPAEQPAGPVVEWRPVPDRHRLFPPMSAAALAAVELPWLEHDTTAHIGPGETAVRRDRDRLVTGDGREAGRFDGLRLLTGDVAEVPGEPDLLEVTRYDQRGSRPMEAAEIIDLLRRLPTRNDAWVTVVHPAGCVQMLWDDGRLWLETPDPGAGCTTGKFATLDEVEQTLTILTTEHRVAVADLPGVTTESW